MDREELEQILSADDPDALRAYVENELRTIIERKLRAEDLRHYRLVYYGTEGAGDRIIPYAL